MTHLPPDSLQEPWRTVYTAGLQTLETATDVSIKDIGARLMLSAIVLEDYERRTVDAV